jgi:transcriptional regulator with XRE-family HTH domain
MNGRDVAIAFGRVLRECRRQAGMSQESLALRANIDRTYVSMLERGIRSPTLQIVFRLGEVLGLSGATLVSRTASHLSGRRPAAGSAT